jgi:hypothetical protein
MSRNKCALTVLLAAWPGLPATSQVSVWTWHNDNSRTGQNLSEAILSPANVNTNTFGMLFSYNVDGYVYAQPLCVSGVTVPGRGTHNVLFVATSHNSVYALDADNGVGPIGGLLWWTNLGPSAPTPNSYFGGRYGPYTDVLPEVGITGTPAIDLASGTLYLDAFTQHGASFTHSIHALNITNGTERSGSPVAVAASVPGTGVEGDGSVVTFDAQQQLQRCAMTLAGGMIYVAYAGYADTDPYHGWVLGFNPGTFKLATNYVFNDTPNSTIAAYGQNAGEGGIWMGGCGLAVDANTNLYLMTGNGSFNGTSGLGGTEFGDSVLRLTTGSNGLAAADFFAPADQAVLAGEDGDLGSGGALLLPDAEGTANHPHLLVGCGKEGTIYLLDRDHLGFYHPTTNHVVQELDSVIKGSWNTPAYFNHSLYFCGSGDVNSSGPLTAFKISNGLLSSGPDSQTAANFAFPGTTPAVSANGTNNAIVWALECGGSGGPTPATLHAYSPVDLTQEFYNSGQAGNRDRPGNGVKFALPVIANGKVFVGSQYSVSVYGLLDPYLNWKYAHFGANATNPAVAGDFADPDHDGAPNLLEYALASNPAAADTNAQIVGMVTSNRFEVTFHRNVKATNLTYVLQSAASLGASWTNVATHTALAGWTANLSGATISESEPFDVPPDQYVVSTITDPTAVPGAKARFYRLQVHR